MLGGINIVSDGLIWGIILIMLTCSDQQTAAYKGSRMIECVVLFSILRNNFSKTVGLSMMCYTVGAEA